MTLTLITTSVVPVVAQPKAAQSGTHIRVFEGPN